MTNISVALATAIIESATKPTEYKPFIGHNRFGIITHLHLVDEVPERYIVEKELELDWWNDIEGYFKANEKNGIRDCREHETYEIPSGYEVKKSSPLGGLNLAAVGDRLMDKNYIVYKITGFINYDSSNHYFDVW